MSRLGIVGAGQLARMTYQAAIALGVPVRVLAERPDEAAALVAADVALGSASSWEDLSAFAATVDVVTFDHELTDPEHLARLEAEGRRLHPGAEAQRFAQDKLHQRVEFARLGLPVPAFGTDVVALAAECGWPVVAKARRGGYDGRGVWVLDGPEAPVPGGDLVFEALVPIERELAVVVARRADGEAVAYPVVETVQADGMCREVLAPAPVPLAVAAAAERLGREVAEATGAVGVLAVELFLTPSGHLLVNEVATRPHNSGHFSIEGAVASQFENHLRAVLGWPLGDPSSVAPAVAMVNVVGAEDGGDPTARLAEALGVPGAHVHLYGKAFRPGRKLGHVTAVGDDPAEVRARAQRAAALLTGGP